MDPFVGEIKMVGFNFAPRGYAFCNANLLAISQNSALFSLLGTTFGGNGTTNFQLPDYRGRAAIGMGNGPNLTPVVQGEQGGTESVTLNTTQMPTHNHTAVSAIAIPAATGDGGSPSPSATSILASVADGSGGGATPQNLYLAGAATTTLLPFNVNATVGNAGGNQPFSIRNPYLGTNFIIALSGVFPSRP